MTFRPPDGEFIILNYRVSDDFKLPFRLFPFIEEIDAKRLDVVLKLRLDIDEKHSALNVIAKLNVPKVTQSVSSELGSMAGQSVDYNPTEKMIYWMIKKIPGSTELVARCKITLSESNPNARKEIGPVNLNFEIPQFTSSNVEIRFLKILDTSASPKRWIRYITQSSSYVFRL